MAATFILLTRESFVEGLRDFSSSPALRVYDDCANAIQLSPLSVSMLLLPLVLMLVISYRLGTGRRVHR